MTIESITGTALAILLLATSTRKEPLRGRADVGAGIILVLATTILLVRVLGRLTGGF